MLALILFHTMKVIDISGQAFGDLTARERVGKDKHRKSLWRCECKCGGEKVVTITTEKKE